MASIRKRLPAVAAASAAVITVAGSMVLPATAVAVPNLLSQPDTCKSGYVWREATGPGDHVCVTPGVRAQAKDDNAHAAARRVSPSDPTCISGYVWREATANDLVCVTPGTRTQTKDDNAHAASRVQGS
ncbi:hypothetical protein GCM10010343_11140 [Streptomyces avidinii]|nr:hypothetical protein GCM10010343_11140 [Streptomyces avidinii]